MTKISKQVVHEKLYELLTIADEEEYEAHKDSDRIAQAYAQGKTEVIEDLILWLNDGVYDEL